MVLAAWPRALDQMVVRVSIHNSALWAGGLCSNSEMMRRY